MAEPPATELLGLPTEMILEIIIYLDYLSCLALLQTNSCFKSMITLTSERKLLFLCEAETWTEYVIYHIWYSYRMVNFSRYESHFSCSRCLKLRLRGAFGDRQLEGKRGKGLAESDRRFCLDCGVSKEIYQPGYAIKIREASHFLCGLCRRLCGSGFYCVPCAACKGCIQNSRRLIKRYPECPNCREPYQYLGDPHKESMMQSRWPWNRIHIRLCEWLSSRKTSGWWLVLSGTMRRILQEWISRFRGRFICLPIKNCYCGENTRGFILHHSLISINYLFLINAFQNSFAVILKALFLGNS